MATIKKISVRFMTAIVFLSIFSTFNIPVLAASTTAFDSLSTVNYAKVYTLSASGSTIPYTSKSLSTRGSVTYGKSNSAYIDNRTDELRLCDVGVSNGRYWAYVSYPIGSKRAYAYIPLSAISNNNGSHIKTTSTGKFYCSYRKTAASSSSYYVDKNDTVYLLNTDGNQYQILYPTGSGVWRIGFCSKSDYNKYCKSSSTTTKTVNKVENNVNYTYVTISVDTSSLNNWLASMKSNESYICNANKGVVVAAKVISTKQVVWEVPKSSKQQGPGLYGTTKVKYDVPSVIQYKLHKHTQNTGFGKSWYYSNGCIITVYTCNCGYRKELMAWEIPLPDGTGTYNSKRIIQGLPQIN